MSIVDTRRDQLYPVLDAAQIGVARRFASVPPRDFAPGATIFAIGERISASWLVHEARSRSRAATGSLLGRAEMKLAGRLSGVAPVLAWTEVARYPEDLESIAGISGGPMIDANGNVVGIIVAASTMRGRNYTVAPELLAAIARKFGAFRGAAPARDALAPPVALDRAAEALSKNMRIAEIYCVPAPPT